MFCDSYDSLVVTCRFFVVKFEYIFCLDLIRSALSLKFFVVVCVCVCVLKSSVHVCVYVCVCVCVSYLYACAFVFVCAL